MSHIDNNNAPVCPHCQTEFDIDSMMYDFNINMWEEQNDEIVVCPECGKKFFLTIAAHYEYQTDIENGCGETPEEEEQYYKEIAERIKNETTPIS